MILKETDEPVTAPESPTEKLTTSKLAKKIGLKTAELVERLVTLGLLELREGKPYITPNGKEAGGEFRMSQKFGPYFFMAGCAEGVSATLT